MSCKLLFTASFLLTEMEFCIAPRMRNTVTMTTLKLREMAPKLSNKSAVHTQMQFSHFVFSESEHSWVKSCYKTPDFYCNFQKLNNWLAFAQHCVNITLLLFWGSLYKWYTMSLEHIRVCECDRKFPASKKDPVQSPHERPSCTSVLPHYCHLSKAWLIRSIRVSGRENQPRSWCSYSLPTTEQPTYNLNLKRKVGEQQIFLL